MNSVLNFDVEPKSDLATPKAFKLLMLGVIPIHFLCFYWWSAGFHYFSGDGLYYFSRQISSLPELAMRFLVVDEMYQYRPLTYVFFSFVLYPLFGSDPQPYHLVAYLLNSVNTVLACACIYYWIRKKTPVVWFAVIFVVLNPVHFFPSFGPTYIDQWLSSFFYFATLLLLLRDSPYMSVLTPITFLLALFSKEHSVTLPVNAGLVLLASGVSWRDVLRRTRNLWIVLLCFFVFQLIIRNGALFAPQAANPNLQFAFSFARLVDLASGAKAAIFYPENYWMDDALGFGRMIRLGTLSAWVVIFIVAIRRNSKLAASGLLWFAISLLPIAFIKVAPFPRHYYLGLPGLAILFASAVPSLRAMSIATSALVFVTVTNVWLYANESWIAVGARRTKAYCARIEALVQETGRSSFYVLNAGDSIFPWHVDNGAAIPTILNRDVTFRFAAQAESIPTDLWLRNQVAVVVARHGDLIDAAKAGFFPPPGKRDLCKIVDEIVPVRGICSVLYRGQPVLETTRNVVESPNGFSIFRVQEGIVTLSRTTIQIDVTGGLNLRRNVRLVPESADGVVVEVYKESRGFFEKLFSQDIGPAEQRNLDFAIAPGQADHVVIRISPGSDGDERGDWLVWLDRPIHSQSKTAPESDL